MNYPTNRWTRIIFVMVILMGGAFSLVSPARAQGITVTFEDSVPAGEVVENDAILSGTNVKIDGKVVGDAYAVGAIVEVNGDVDGSLVAIGQNVMINGAVTGTTYVASLTLELGEDAELGRNLYFIGGNINTAEGSIIGRDLVTISFGGRFNGEIGRNTVGIIGPFEMIKIFMDLIGRPLSEPQTGLGASGVSYRLDDRAVNLSGFLPSVSSIALTRTDEQPIARTNLNPASSVEIDLPAQTDSAIDSDKVLDWLRWIATEFFTLLVFGLFGIWLFSSFLKRSGQKIESKPLKSTGIGLLGLVISVALIGVGNLGTAFLNYNFMKNNNTKIEMAFEVSEEKVGKRIADVPIYHMDQIDTLLQENNITAAILTVPAQVAQTITDRLVKADIKGILNFTPARLTVPPSIRVHHIDLAVELQSLIYFLKHYPVVEEAALEE